MQVLAVLQQHVDDSTVLAANRMTSVKGRVARLGQFVAVDRRLRAHFSGLCRSGKTGWALCDEALESPSGGLIFTMTVLALEAQDGDRLESMLAIARAIPDTSSGLLAAFEWAEWHYVAPFARDMLASDDDYARWIAIEAFDAHRVDPGPSLSRLTSDSSAPVRTTALRAAGHLGRKDLLANCLAALDDEDVAVCGQAARSAVMLGDRLGAVDALELLAFDPKIQDCHNLPLLLQVSHTVSGNEVLRRLQASQQSPRQWIEGSAYVGDCAAVQPLVTCMRDPLLARIAGDSFAQITGAEIDNSELVGAAPIGESFGPSDDPDDAYVAMDPDEGLPWPNQSAVQAWWTAAAHQFTPGIRHFMGSAPSWHGLVSTLSFGRQHQRSAAARQLCLMAPGRPLFSTAAPVWRQIRAIEQL